MRLFNIKFSSMVLALFLFSSLYASETRVATMGGGGIFLQDQSNIFLFPGTIHQYPDLVVTEMRVRSNDRFYSIGMHMDYGSMTSGLYINQPINSILLSTGQSQLLNNATPINSAFAYFLGMELGGMDAGFGFIGASTSYEDNSFDPKQEESATYMGILAGVSNDMMDLGLLFELPSITLKNPDAEYSGFGLQANGRYYLAKRNGYSIYPVASVSFGSTEIKDAIEYGLFAFAVGVGVEKQINDDNLFVVGLEVSRIQTSSTPNGGVESTFALTTLPGVYVGIESRISSWLIGRVGATQVNQQGVNKTDGDQTGLTTSSDFLVSLGLGMEFSNFLLDFNINETSLFDGPYIFAGTGAGTPFATSISITYNFGGEDDE